MSWMNKEDKLNKVKGPHLYGYSPSTVKVLLFRKREHGIINWLVQRYLLER